jgi:hypothetical protein
MLRYVWWEDIQANTCNKWETVGHSQLGLALIPCYILLEIGVGPNSTQKLAQELRFLLTFINGLSP